MTDIVLIPSEYLPGLQDEIFSQSCKRLSLSYHSVEEKISGVTRHAEENDICGIVCDLTQLRQLSNLAVKEEWICQVPVLVLANEDDAEHYKRVFAPNLRIAASCNIPDYYTSGSNIDPVVTSFMKKAVESHAGQACKRSRLLRKNHTAADRKLTPSG